MSKLDKEIGKAAACVDEVIHEWLEKQSVTSIRREIPQIHLSLEEQRTLQAGLASLDVTDSTSGIRHMPVLGQLLESVLCTEKIQQLRNFPQSPEVAMIVRGLPLDPHLPATPYDLEPGIENLSTLAGAILSVLQTLQTRPLAYEGESSDTVFRHVSPNHADVVHHILLQPGDMLIFKNQQTLHARDGFTPRYDGRDRWMLRVFGVNDPARVMPLDPHQPYIVRA